MLARSPEKTNKSRRPRSVSPKLREHLAVCAASPESVLFLDIETTGLSHFYDEITIVGWSLNGKVSTLVKGEDHSQLLEDASRANALVTFNGIRFDQRFLCQEFPEISLPEIHIDLMYLCRRVGLTGGQKAIENELGLQFRNELEEVDGLAAVLLWHRYLRGDLGALEKLIRYNRADIAAMGAIFDEAIERLSVEPDLFSGPIEFQRWSAPNGWYTPPKNLKPASIAMSTGPHFTDLFRGSPAESARIVGIDLTGSESRGSGWCLLEGSHAAVATLFTDEDIIERTLSTNPDIVSIDSPLCLPAGRISVEDSDPGREQFGIMRQCERELKRRGINVYPCLLPSMQKLTARGIQLAESMRKKGVPVIESYPGAAQDIMRIPRKGAGVEWLRVGLSDFGISGNYQDEKTSHDELDAITSALVGMFHLAGLSEELGTKEEPPLIIPKLDGKPGPVVVGVSGPVAAGKTTFARTLEKRGFSYTRFSLVIDEMLRELGLELNRINRLRIGSKINSSGEQRELAIRTIERVAGAAKIVVDGLRYPEDHAFFVERFGARFRHFHVDANESIRRIRYIKRDGDEGFDEVTKSPVENRVEELRSLAHEIVSNESKLWNIEKRTDEFIDHINREKICLFLS